MRRKLEIQENRRIAEEQNGRNLTKILGNMDDEEDIFNQELEEENERMIDYILRT